MIELVYQNGCACVFSPADWAILYKEHRIVGSLEGGTRNRMPALPVILIHEETSLLITKNLAKLVTYPNIKNRDTQSKLDAFVDLQQKLLEAQIVEYKQHRRKDLEQLIDKIYEAKKKKHPEIALKTRDEVLEDELNKSFTPAVSSMLWPTLTKPLQSVLGPSVEVPILEISKNTTKARCAIFTDLWEKGYYITSASKFSGQFLVYCGDPITFHAIYIIRCIEDPNNPNHVSDLMAFGRLAHSVRKRGVLASANAQDEVSYISLNWART